MPQHVDLEAYGKALRAGMDASHQEALDLAPDHESRMLVEAQIALSDMAYTAAIEFARARNEGKALHLVAGLSFVMANIVRNVVGPIGPETTELFMSQLQAIVAGDLDDKKVMTTITAPTEEGGHA